MFRSCDQQTWVTKTMIESLWADEKRHTVPYTECQDHNYNPPLPALLPSACWLVLVVCDLSLSEVHWPREKAPVVSKRSRLWVTMNWTGADIQVWRKKAPNRIFTMKKLHNIDEEKTTHSNILYTWYLNQLMQRLTTLHVTYVLYGISQWFPAVCSKITADLYIWPWFVLLTDSLCIVDPHGVINHQPPGTAPWLAMPSSEEWAHLFTQPLNISPQACLLKHLLSSLERLIQAFTSISGSLKR